MAYVLDILPQPVEDQKVFILDHGKKEDGVLKYQDDIDSYGWNLHRFKKLKPGAFVLNRHPGKITSDKKFEIYGGGYVESVSAPDEEGNVVAKITHAFKLVKPLRQGNSFIENFEWTTKNKNPNNWSNFWNMYGMNEISMDEFTRLMDNRECELYEENDIDEELTNEELEQIQSGGDEQEFTISIEDTGTRRTRNSSTVKRVSRNVDYEALQRSRSKIGSMGEGIVLSLLITQAEEQGLMKPEHVSVTIGDHLGYDIKSFDSDGNEVHIEVKTTKRNYVDGFDMTRNEVEESRNPNFKYLVYRVYDLDVNSGTCKLAILDGPFTDDSYDLVPTSYRVHTR